MSYMVTMFTGFFTSTMIIILAVAGYCAAVAALTLATEIYKAKRAKR